MIQLPVQNTPKCKAFHLVQMKWTLWNCTVTLPQVYTNRAQRLLQSHRTGPPRFQAGAVQPGARRPSEPKWDFLIAPLDPDGHQSSNWSGDSQGLIQWERVLPCRHLTMAFPENFELRIKPRNSASVYFIKHHQLEGNRLSWM